MAGRLPFDTNQSQNNNVITNSQMRAALGLPLIEEIFLGQQRAHQEQAQRDLQYRRALYQDHLDHQLQELHLRANLAQLDDLSGLRSRLLLSEHQRRTAEQDALLRQAVLARQTSSGAAAAAGPASAASSLGTSGVSLHQAVAEAQAAQSLYEEKLKLIQEQDQAKRRQEEMLMMQVRQAMQGQQATALQQHQVVSLPHPHQHPPTSPSLVAQQLLRRTDSQDDSDIAASLGHAFAANESERSRKAARRNSYSPVNGPNGMPVGFLKSPPIVNMTGLATLEDMADVAAQEAKVPRLGTVEDILQAADGESKVFDSVDVLTSLRTVEWPDSDSEDGQGGIPGIQKVKIPKEPVESIETPFFHSYFPALPCEPVYAEPELAEEENTKEAKDGKLESNKAGKTDDSGKEDGDSAEVVSNVLQYPYPVDTWFPAVNSRKRERRQQGEISDEDEFVEDKEVLEKTHLRANSKKIRQRLCNEMEPGVIEKLPHCRLHRMRTKYTTVSELLFCFQVTESYPNDMMVNCSRCGTWRHAACGGHYKPLSVNECAKESFVAICDHCHSEEKYLEENSRGKHFLERQRIEHVRRGLASSAVMRQMAFMKHGGNYKWPLGSVSATHVGGHIRSVVGRFDKTEKQWGDLASRLSRRFGASTSKERSRARTKELERLLVCVEDAEGQTDRHNMLLFLERDTRRQKPVGFEKKRRNMFDPEIVVQHHHELENAGTADDASDYSSVVSESVCARRGCKMKHRFDSLFCSDACGVTALESDLLKAFHEASDIHPSVLRFSY